MTTTKTRKQASGAIDKLVDGVLSGWFAHSQEDNPHNRFYIRIDNDAFGPFEAEQYRPDLAALDIRQGFVGFHLPLLAHYLDDNLHRVGLYEDLNDKPIVVSPLKLRRSDKLAQIEATVIASRCNRNYLPSGERFAVYSTFSASGRLLNYHRKTIGALQQAGYYVVLTFPIANEPYTFNYNKLLDAADLVIIRRNEGYDFGSWATGILTLRAALFSAQSLLIFNDSVIGPFASLDNMLAHFENSPGDLWAVSDSYDHQYHVQSYFVGFKSSILQSSYLDEFFFYRNGLISDKTKVIGAYELSMLAYFREHHFSHSVFQPYSELMHDFYRNTFKLLSEMDKKNRENKTHILHGNRVSTLNIESFLINTLSHLENGVTLNPSHYFWREMLEKNFPFIKKELLLKNPTDNPLLMYGVDGLQHPDHRQLLDEVFMDSPGSRYPALLDTQRPPPKVFDPTAAKTASAPVIAPNKPRRKN